MFKKPSIFLLILILYSLNVDVRAIDAPVNQRGTFISWKPKSNSPQGCIYGTIGNTWRPQNEKQSKLPFWINIQERQYLGTGKEISRVEYLDLPRKTYSYSDDLQYGHVFAVCLKPGDYNILGYGYGSGWIYFSKPGFEIPFAVTQDSHTYVGNFSLSNSNSANISGCQHVKSNIFIQLLDRSDRDIPLIMNQKNAPESIPKIQIIVPDPTNPYFINCGE